MRRHFELAPLIVFAFLAFAQNSSCADPNDDDVRRKLSASLTLQASFDQNLSADFARGDKTCFYAQGAELVPAKPTESVRLDESAGRFGGALHFTRKSNDRPLFTDGVNLGYNDNRWSGSISVWLRLNPDEDLEPGYCDPVQIIGDDMKRGFIFLEWSKDDVPRHFRYAVRPLNHIWNPENLAWDAIPAGKRPMVQVERAPFSREQWTHALFTFDGINDTSGPQLAQLYLNGKLQGTIQDWDLTFGWDPTSARLVLGAAYVGFIDDLAVFDRPLTNREVQYIYESNQSVAELY